MAAQGETNALPDAAFVKISPCSRTGHFSNPPAPKGGSGINILQDVYGTK